MKLFTIGFTKKGAEKFFGLLKSAGVKRVVDIRLNNVSQLAGFAKRDDLQFFLKKLHNIDYIHLPELAPTKQIRDEYQKDKDWGKYVQDFMALMKQRQVQKTVSQADIADGCLLCSEDTADQCHRRLVAEYLSDHWGNIDIEHLR